MKTEGYESILSVIILMKFHLLSRLGSNTSESAFEIFLGVTQSNILVVFMDLHMPIMDGYNCTKCIRDMGIDVPIVALTANAMSGEKDKCISIGMDEFILKPIQLKILEGVLNKYILNN